MADPERGFKDTARNIIETGEFVVNLVPESLVRAMNITAVDAPTEVDELALAGLEQAALTACASAANRGEPGLRSNARC